MFTSLISMIQMISSMYGSNKDVKQMADILEQQVVRYKQTQLLYQMKALLSQKIKALLETLNYNSVSQKKRIEIEKQVQQLSETLLKIELSINPNSDSSPQAQLKQFITPQPRRQYCVGSFSYSQDGMTPILSEDAEKKAKVQFITPVQGSGYQIPIHQSSSHNHHFSLETSVMLNKTLNSFNNEHYDSRIAIEKDHIQEFIKNAAFPTDKEGFQTEKAALQTEKEAGLNELPQFGVKSNESSAEAPRTIHFQNEFMTQCLEITTRNQASNEQSEEEHQGEVLIENFSEVVRTIPRPQTMQSYPESPQTNKNSQKKQLRRTLTSSLRYESQKAQKHQRKISTQSLQQTQITVTNQSPATTNEPRFINSTNTKRQSKGKEETTPSNRSQTQFDQFKNEGLRTNLCQNQTFNHEKSLEKSKNKQLQAPPVGVNLLSKLNQADGKQKENKENLNQVNKKQIIISCANDPKKAIIGKKMAPQLIKQKSNGIIKPAPRQK